MHRCLAIPEVLLIIFQYACDWDTDPYELIYPIEGSDILARLARTCGLFLEPALNLLWHTQSSLKPLLRCLPADAIKTYKRASIELARDLRPSDYSRICYYARRIKVFGVQDRIYGHQSDVQFHPLLLPTLLSRRPEPGPLLPNVKEYWAYLHDFGEQALIPRLVVGPNLRNITLFDEINLFNRDPTTYAWDNVRAVLQPYASTLTSVATTIRNEDNEIFRLGTPSDLMLLFSRFQSLEQLLSLDVEIPHGILSDFAALPNLKALEISISSTELAQFNDNCLSSTSFPSLTGLAVQTEELMDFATMLECTAFRKLESILVRRHADIGIWDLDHFFSVLNRTVDHTKLDSLYVVVKNSWFEAPIVTTVTPQTLTHVFPFINLVDLHISTKGSFDVENSTLKAMAESWPHIQRLELIESTMNTIPKTTLAGLLPLASLCPELENLGLRLNALEKIPNYSQLGDIVPARNLLKFDACTSPVNKPATVAAFLTMLFPQLTYLSYGWTYSELDVWALDDLPPNEILYMQCWENIRSVMKTVTDEGGET